MNPGPYDRSEIKSTLRSNLSQAGMHDGQFLVATTAFGGLRIRVVHEGFAGMADLERRELAMRDLPEEDAIVELLTPTELEWAGGSFIEDDAPLPVWPDVLASPPDSGELVFASDLDKDLERPIFATFYSLRGGVGRTTALGSVAKILAARGRRVVCLDMDFEAPGLAYFFGLPPQGEDIGALPLLAELEEGGSPDVRRHILRPADEYDLYVLPAGELGPAYVQQLRFADPEVWYRESVNPLHRLLDLVAGSSLAPDVVLLDSRTGVSPISAPLLFDISDVALISFFPHPQARLGTELLVKSLFNTRNRRAETTRLTPLPRFLISPVPPGPSAVRVRERALGWIADWMTAGQDRRPIGLGQLRAEELTHFVPYSAETAFRDVLSDADSLGSVYGPVADWLEQLLPSSEGRSGRVVPASKQRALSQMRFATGTAEQQERFLEDFVPTKTSVAALARETPLVVGRKGTGKTAVFRWLLENPTAPEPPVVVMCPSAFRSRAPWVLGAAGFESIDRLLSTAGRTWQDFWACYVPLSAYLSSPRGRLVEPPERLRIGGLSSLAVAREEVDELHVVDLLGEALNVPECGLLGARWLRDMDRKTGEPSYLLFDGLDTGFGNDDSSRRRRQVAVTGLFTFLTELEPLLRSYAFKVLLRYDIWQGLRFENKSHLLGRSVQLVWRDQAEYFKTVLKQAARSPEFRGMLDEARVGPEVDAWLDDEVFRAWNLLVGERMKGGNTTFTRNWVWNRLADGQGDHGPRALYQLFHSAVTWEIREETRSPYDRSIIRPRALVPSLEVVSGEAVGAIREEFPELEPLIGALETIGRTPVAGADVAAVSQEAEAGLELALEVGMLALPQSSQDDEARFRVPELYRHALKVTRPGQA